MTVKTISRGIRVIPALLAFALHVEAQFLEPNKYVSVKYESRNPAYNNLKKTKITNCNQKVYLQWTVEEDSIGGFFAIYKSDNFSGLTLVDFVKIPEGINNKNEIMFSAIDTSEISEVYSYYLVRIDNRSVRVLDMNNIWAESIAVLQTPIVNINSNRRESNQYTQDYTQVY